MNCRHFPAARAPAVRRPVQLTPREIRKRIWRGQREARRAHSKAHFRIKVYRCPECRGYHATARDKA